MTHRILIVDDEPTIRQSLELILKSSFDVVTAQNGREGLERISENAPDVVLLDVMMPELGGLETLRCIREQHRGLPVIMLTGAGTVKTAVDAMKAGAFDYVNKPFEVDELTSIISAALGQVAEGTGNIRPTTATSATLTTDELPGDCGAMVGKSQPMQEVFANIKHIARRDTTVLITGESGTGKELVAREIHRSSERAEGPFVALNCGAIPETLIESELFGHEKGSFTNAVEKRIGQCELANRGTLFLDEIGELSLSVQVKLLRFLQERELQRVGGAKPIKVDVRIVAATNRNLEQMMREGKFRQDLFYRINVVHLTLPSLRDRFEDIPVFIEHFIKKCSPRYSGRTISFTNDAQRRLIEYSWPGNVRELENTIESLLALAPQDVVREEDLPRKISRPVVAHADGNLRPFPMAATPGQPAPVMAFEEAERAFERDMIVKALKRANFVQTKAAEILGISRRILKYKMDKLGISTDEPGQAEG